MVPSMKLTLPAGVRVEAVVAVAVKVTLWPRVDGLGADVSAVVVAARAIVSVNACVAFGAMPLFAVIVQLYVLAVPVAGVPASVAVPLALSVKVTLGGSTGAQPIE